MSNEQGKPLKRILAVLDRVESILKNSSLETHTMAFSQFSKGIDLLQDSKATAIACNRVNTEAGENVQVLFNDRTVTTNELTASSGINGVPVTSTLQEVEMHIGDWYAFNRYRSEINTKLLGIVQKPRFLITRNGNLAYVVLEGGDTFNPVEFKVGSKRFKLIDLLMNKKSVMKSAEITALLSISAGQLHNLVEGVRSRLVKGLGVSNDDFLIYDENDGYRIINTVMST